MKIDRLIGIIITLLQKEKVTAPELAEKFEVSRRTINRDIEDLCKAGIPVMTAQGMHGGISIFEGYKIDRTVFNERELGAILTGLMSLDSVAQDSKYQKTIDKFGLEKHGIVGASHILIDLSSHYKNSLAPKIETIQAAIEARFEIVFTYYNHAGERVVTLDPYLIVFQWSSWYVLGVDHASNDFKLYKLNRLWQLACTDRQYAVKAIPQDKLAFHRYFTDEINAVIIFEESVKHRLVESYGPNSFTADENHKLRFECSFTNEAYLIEWVLSFGDQAVLLEPPAIRETIKTKLQKMMTVYTET
ncbi:MAG: hypothetical protein PWP51_2544 [Clostridiales bacterium]|jgi:predicted DNA-binding transcriptional regulator YafY|nr:hypothetical protein [Clostridiales bacterium]MDN5299991.1 hypothetical protein [Clostridiales bacterium]